MPEVPYKPVPSVAPEDRPTPRVGIEFGRIHFAQSIGEALGQLGAGRQVLGRATEQVGGALAQLGGSFERAGDEIFSRAAAIKGVENQTAATEADTKYLMMSVQQEAAFQSQTGNAASQGLDAHMKSLDNLRQQIRSTLPNDQARHMYDHQSLQTMSRAVWRAGMHAAQQGKAAALGAEKARSDMEVTDLFNHATGVSDEEFDSRLKDLMQRWEEREAPLEGLKGDQLKEARQQRLSKYWAARIGGIGQDDQQRALALLNKAQDENWIKPDAADGLRTKLGKQYENTFARNETDKLTDFLNKPATMEERRKEPTEAQIIQKAWDKVDADPMLKDKPGAKMFIAQQISAKFSVINKVRADQDKRDKYILDYAADGKFRPDQPIPRTMEEFKAQHPGVEEAFNRADPAVQRKYEGFVLGRNNKTDYPPTNEQHREVRRIMGMLQSDDRRAEALDIDIESMPWPRAWRDKVQNEQQRVAKLSGADPRINKWMQLGGTDIPESIRRGDDKDLRDLYKNSLMEAGEAFQETMKRPPTAGEVKQIVRFLNEEVGEGTFWRKIFGQGGYQRWEIPPNKVTEYMRRFGVNENVAKDIYIRSQMIDRLKGVAPARREGITPSELVGTQTPTFTITPAETE